jgi:hypothetical protein
MKKTFMIFVLVLALSCLNIYPAFSDSGCEEGENVQKIDVDNSGAPDVAVYSEGKYITKVEADTNHDGKPDIIVRIKDGVFQSAEADTNYDGTMDKTFTDANAFNQWINDTHPAFKKILARGSGEWTVPEAKP